MGDEEGTTEIAAGQIKIHADKLKKPIAEATELPTEFSLSNAYPNPFNPTTTIQYSIPADYSGQVILNIYDIRGALVRTLVDEQQNPGLYNTQWDGLDDSGKQVSSGLYLYQLKAGMKVLSGKMTFMQ